MARYVEKEFKTIINKLKYIDSWFWARYTINPYSGCEHACLYCDARSEKYYLHHDLDNEIYVKKDVGIKLDKRLKNARTLLPDIVALGGVTGQNTPIFRRGVPSGDQIITRLYHPKHISAEELTPVLDRFKSTEGDITIYAPTNMLIITDYGTAIQRLVKLIDVLDQPGTGEQIWIEPVNYADAAELANRILDLPGHVHKLLALPRADR